MKKGHDSYRKIKAVINTEGAGCSELELNQILDQVESIRVNSMMADAEDVPQMRKPRRPEAEESKRKPKDPPAKVAAAKKLAAKPAASTLYSKGDRVDVHVYGMWFPGTVARNQEKGGKIFVEQDDGDKVKLDFDRVRPKTRSAK